MNAHGALTCLQVQGRLSMEQGTGLGEQGPHWHNVDGGTARDRQCWGAENCPGCKAIAKLSTTLRGRVAPSSSEALPPHSVQPSLYSDSHTFGATPGQAAGFTSQKSRRCHGRGQEQAVCQPLPPSPPGSGREPEQRRPFRIQPL